MQAFLNDSRVKKKYLDRVIAHKEADEIVKGVYWEKGKGCAVGCTIHGDDHSKYETKLGIPEWLARLEDTIFEGLPSDRAKAWPEEFLKTIAIGIDLEQIKKPFMIFILENCLESLDSCVFDKEKNPNVVEAILGSKKAVEDIIKLHKENIEESAAWSAARSAAWSAESAAWSAAWSAESAAWSAAWSAARSAAYVKYADKLLELIRECK